jgi:quinolinate synthase|tara:strand:+ start:4689 stop:5885 length:1197 start_codon:yes stop_codon:yes gene_type:complete
MTTMLPRTELEQDAFCQESSELFSKPLIEEYEIDVQWQKIPQRYARLDPKLIEERIWQIKEQLGSKLTILAHHYQRDEVFQFADGTGDSYKLSKYAAQQTSEYIVFCGVHFMAETADILTTDNQKVILPNLLAGCSMADMADISDVEDAWTDITNLLDDTLIPITYMNSTAAIKALCGRNNGIVCTSSNADKAFKWAFNRGNKIIFLPDQHLGRNTAYQLGIKDDDIIVWNPFKQLGGNTEQAVRNAKVILWQGHCSVHTRFTVEQINNTRNNYPTVNVIAHPECTSDVVSAADYVGSTEFIINTIANAEEGTIWAVGTEISLVNRLAKTNPDKQVVCLDSIVCPCATMYRIHPAYVLWTLEGILFNNPVNVINVSREDKEAAKVALDRMLSLEVIDD